MIKIDNQNDNDNTFTTTSTINVVNIDKDMSIILLLLLLPASVAQLDVHPIGDQEVAGLTPAEVSNIHLRRLIMKYFLRSFSPFC